MRKPSLFPKLRAVPDPQLAPLNISTTNLIAGTGTAFGLSLSQGSAGSIDSLNYPDTIFIPYGIRWFGSWVHIYPSSPAGSTGIASAIEPMRTDAQF